MTKKAPEAPKFKKAKVLQAAAEVVELLANYLPLYYLFGMTIYSCVLAIMLDRKHKFRLPRAAGAPVDNEASEGEETLLSSNALDAEQHVIEVL